MSQMNVIFLLQIEVDANTEEEAKDLAIDIRDKVLQYHPNVSCYLDYIEEVDEE